MATREPGWQCHPGRWEEASWPRLSPLGEGGRAGLGSVPTAPLSHSTLSWVGQGSGVPVSQIKKLRLTEVR